jgi:hypothetical protein
MSTKEKEALARRFLSLLGHPDAEVVKSVSADDVVWSFPGAASITAVFSFRGDKITRLDTYLSDVPMMERFFA